MEFTEKDKINSVSDEFKFPVWFWIIGGCLTASTIVPLFVYVLFFRKHPWSDSPGDWGVFGDYIGGTLNPILALTGVFVTIALAYMANRANKVSIIRREMEVRPLARIALGDYENVIEVKIENAGLGPLIIDSLTVFDENGNSKKSVIAWFDDIREGQIKWKEYIGDAKDFIISPGKEIILIQLEIDHNNPKNYESRDRVRKRLSGLTIRLTYKDVYSNILPAQIRNLDWFARFIFSEKRR